MIKKIILGIIFTILLISFFYFLNKATNKTVCFSNYNARDRKIYSPKVKYNSNKEILFNDIDSGSYSCKNIRAFNFYDAEVYFMYNGRVFNNLGDDNICIDVYDRNWLFDDRINVSFYLSN